MKRLVFIVEGDSELRFVKEVLEPYFHSSGLYNGIQCFKLKHSGGGISKYAHVRADVVKTLYEQDAVVTTMVDFIVFRLIFLGLQSLLPLHPALSRWRCWSRLLK